MFRLATAGTVSGATLLHLTGRARLPCKCTIANTANDTVHIGLTPASQVPAATRTIGGMALVLVAAGAFLSFKDYGDR
jgi:hypothetical protein